VKGRIFLQPIVTDLVVFLLVGAGILLILPACLSLEGNFALPAIYRFQVSCSLGLGMLGIGAAVDHPKEEMRFFLRLFGIPLALPSPKREKKAVREEVSPEKKPEKKRGKGAKLVRFFWRRKARLWEYLRTLVRSFFGKRGRAQVCFGFEDPALTGQVLGKVYAFQGLLGKNFQVEPHADFIRKNFSGQVKGRALFLLPYLLCTLFVATLEFGLGLRRELKATI
jgi:hypothetical protein